MAEKYKPYSRRELNRLRSEWAKRNRKLIALIGLGVLGLIVFETVLLLLSPFEAAFKGYLMGALQVAFIGVYLWMMNQTFLANNHDAIYHVRGAWGEETTRSQLKRAKRKRLIWGWVDSVTVETGDIDHLVVTRSGGVVAIDSKFRSKVNVGGPEQMAEAARKAARRGQWVAQSLLKSGSGKRRAEPSSIPVRPVVIVWGAEQYKVPDGFRLDGVDFVPGRRVLHWLETLNGDLVEQDAAKEVLGEFEGYRASVATASSRRNLVERASRFSFRIPMRRRL